MEENKSDLPNDEALAWYRNVVKKAFDQRNPHTYHPCCHTYFKRQRAATENLHTETIPFTSLFDNVSLGQQMVWEVQQFYKKHCARYGYLPYKNLPHVGSPAESEKMKSAKSEKMQSVKSEQEQEINEKKSVRALSQDSFDAKDLEVPNPEQLRFQEGFLYTAVTVQNQISELRTETSQAATLSRRLVNDNMCLKIENQRLFNELSEMKKELAVHKKALKDVNARLDVICKEGLGGLLGKREQQNSSCKEEQSANGEEESIPESRPKTPQSSAENSQNEGEGNSPAN